MDQRNSRDNNLRSALFYGISLVLSLIIVVVSTTVFVVVVYLEGSVNQSFFILYIAVVATNIIISAFSIRKLMNMVPLLASGSRKPEIYFVPETGSNVKHEDSSGRNILDEKYFTNAELEIIELLRKNNNRMLQSIIVSSSEASKASISRAISSLENKGIIIKMRKGVTNEIILSETYSG